MRGSEWRPFLCGFGDAILAEIRHSSGDQRLDLGDAALLGDGDEGDIARVTLCRFGGARDLCVHLGEAGCGVGHEPRYRKRHGSEPVPLAARLADDR